METQRYSILYSSKTGNTKKLAEKIREILPEENCEYFGTEGAKALSSDILYIGFWTDIGNADPATLELLKSLKNKKFFCLEQQASEAVKPISSRFSGKLRNLWMRVIQ